MKKLGKLNLKAEKMLSHEELVSFKGGSAYCTCDIYWDHGPTTSTTGWGDYSDCFEMEDAMWEYYQNMGAAAVECN